MQIPINFDTNYGIRRIVASNSISDDESEIEKATTSSETTSNTENYSDHEIVIFQKETLDNVNLIQRQYSDPCEVYIFVFAFDSASDCSI